MPDQEWRDQIRPLTGGDTLEAMIAWVDRHGSIMEIWEWSLFGGSGQYQTLASVSVADFRTVNSQRTYSKRADDPAEAFARAILAAHAATGGV